MPSDWSEAVAARAARRSDSARLFCPCCPCCPTGRWWICCECATGGNRGREVAACGTFARCGSPSPDLTDSDIGMWCGRHRATVAGGKILEITLVTMSHSEPRADSVSPKTWSSSWTGRTLPSRRKPPSGSCRSACRDCWSPLRPAGPIVCLEACGSSEWSQWDAATSSSSPGSVGAATRWTGSNREPGHWCFALFGGQARQPAARPAGGDGVGVFTPTAWR
jgi:hypothetical protein